MDVKYLLNIGDVLSFEYPDKTYGLTVLLKLSRTFNKKIYYDFFPTTYKNTKEANFDDIKNQKIIRYDLPSTGIIENKKYKYRIIVVEHKILKKHLREFKKIGNIKFKDNHEITISGDKIKIFHDIGKEFECFYDAQNELKHKNLEWKEFIKEIPIIEFIK